MRHFPRAGDSRRAEASLASSVVSDAPQFEVYLDDDGVCVVRGELDVFTSPTLEAALATHGQVAIVDLGEVSFVDSEGLRRLLLARQDRAERGGALEIRRASRAVRRVMRLAGVSHLFSLDGQPDQGPAAAG